MRFFRIGLAVLFAFQIYSGWALAQPVPGPQAQPPAQPPAAQPRAPSPPQQPTSAAQASAPSFLWDYRNLVKVEAMPAAGASLGRGWNSFLRQQTASTCVDFEPANEPRWISGVHFREIFDREQLFRSLNLSVAASYGGAIFSASGRVDFARSSTFDASNLNVLATARVQEGLAYAKPPTGAASIALKGEFKKLLADGHIAEFQQACGDHFVVAIASGGELNILSSVNTQSERERSELSAEFKAKYFTASGSASFKTTFDKKRDDNQTEVNFNQEAGPEVSLPLSGSSDEIQTALKAFMVREKFVGRAYEISLFPYWQVDALATRIPSNLSLAQAFSDHAWRLADLSRVYLKALEHPSDYVINLMETETNVIKGQTELHDAARLWDGLVGKCVEQQICENTAEAILHMTPENTGGSTGGFQQTYSPSDLAGIVQYTVGFQRFLQDATRIESRDLQSKVRDVLSYQLQEGDGGSVAKLLPEATKSPSVSPAFKDIAGALVQSSILQEAIAQFQADVIPYNGLVFYLQRLARTPITQAEFKALFIDDQKNKNDIAAKKQNKAEQFDLASDILRNWVLRSRLIPAVRRFCELSSSHPLCVDSNLLASLVKDVRVDPDFKAANFDVPVPPPPTVAPPPPQPRTPPKEPRTEPLPGHCHAGMCP